MKKIFILFIKFIIMLVLLAAAVFVCFFIIISQTGLGMGSGLSFLGILLDIVLFSAILVLYIFLCKKIVCFNPKDYFEDHSEYFKDNYK